MKGSIDGDSRRDCQGKLLRRQRIAQVGRRRVEANMLLASASSGLVD